MQKEKAGMVVFRGGGFEEWRPPPLFARAASFAARPDVSDVETPTRQRLPVAAINDNFQPVPSLISDKYQLRSSSQEHALKDSCSLKPFFVVERLFLGKPHS